MDSQHQTCKVCGRRDKWDFSLPDEVWAEIVPEEFRSRVVCLSCLDDFAAKAGKDYAPFLRGVPVYFAGDAGTLVMRVERGI